MMQRILKTVALVSLGALLGGCGGDAVVSSTNVPTGNMVATIEIYAETENSAYASAQLLRTGSSSGDEFLDLRNGDALWFTSGENLREASLGNDWFETLAALDQVQELFEGEYRYRSTGIGVFFFWSDLIPDQIHYNGRLTDVPEESRYTVSLLRENGTEALHSTVDMPTSFELLAPTSQRQLSRSSDLLIVEWESSASEVNVELDVTTVCGQEVEHQYRITFNGDEGYAELEPGEIDAPKLSGRCSTNVTLAKVEVGQLDPAYAGGSITARQVRSVSFKSTE